jgi:uncharacterized protein (UPF0335 family)
MSEKIDLIYDLIKENRKDLGDFRAEVKEDNTAIQERLVEIEKLDAIQNHQLAEHIRRTELLEELHKENVSRIEKLEEPRKTLSTLSKWLIGIGTVAGALAGILKLIGII